LYVTALNTHTGEIDVVWGDECFRIPFGGSGAMPREIEIVEADLRQIATVAPVEYRAALIEEGARVPCGQGQKASIWAPTLIVGGIAAAFFLTRKR
jgi:hypothetical protein